MRVQKSCGFVVIVQVSEVNHTLSCVKHGGVLDSFTILPFHVWEKVFVAGLGEIAENKGVSPLHIVCCAIFADGVDLDFILLHFFQLHTGVVLTCFKSKIFEFSIFSLVINYKLWLDYVQRHLEKYDTACYSLINNFVGIPELLIFGLKGGVAGSFQMVLNMKWMAPLSCQIWILYWLTRMMLPDTFGSMALIFMSVDVAREDKSFPINHPEKARTSSKVNQWNWVRRFF